MDFYDQHILPRLIDLACGGRPLDRVRRQVASRAQGRVLEVGFGSGLNLAHYDRAAVEWIWALEPSAPMRALAAPRIAASGLDVRLLDLTGESIPLPDASVDSVVMSYTLCTIPDAAAALHQMRRLLRPGGRLLFCEHGAAPDEGVRRWQDRLDRPWSRLAGGCHLNREMAPLIASAGFRFDRVHSAYLPHTPRFAGYNTWGVATPG